MKIEKLKNKHKIMFEYSTKLGMDFDIISEEDMKEIVVNVFLKDGCKIFHEQIDRISIKVKQ